MSAWTSRRDDVEGEQRLDPPLVLEEHRRDLVHGLDLLEALLDHGLALVCLEHLGVAERAVVGHQRDTCHRSCGRRRWPSSSMSHVQVEAPLGDLAVGGVRAGAAAPRLLEDVLLADDAADLEVAAHVVLVQDELDLHVDLGGAAQPGPGGGQALAQPLEVLDRRGDVAQASGVLAQRQQRAPDPDDGPGLHGRQRRPVDVPAVSRPVAVARIGPIPDQGPLGRTSLDRLAKLCILQATARHHGDEASAGAVDVVHVLARAQLAVGHVQEVAAAGHRPERVPGLDVGDRVAGVAVWSTGTPRGRCRRRSS